MSVNHVVLVGRLGADPEMKTTTTGKVHCKLRLATDHWSKDKGERVPDWHRVVAWDRTAENCMKFLSKGKQVAVEGRLTTREYEDKQGQRRWWTEVVAHRVTFLGSRGDAGQGAAPVAAGAGAAAPAKRVAATPMDDDLPF